MLLIRRIVDDRSVCWCHYRTLVCNSVEDTHVGKNRTASASWIIARDALRPHTCDVAVPSAMLSTEYKHSFIPECLCLIWRHNVIVGRIGKIVDLCVRVVIVALRVIQDARKVCPSTFGDGARRFTAMSGHISIAVRRRLIVAIRHSGILGVDQSLRLLLGLMV